VTLHVEDAEHRFRLALESIGIGTWEYAPGTGWLSWDRRCRALLNAGADAPDRYDAFLAAIHPDDRSRVHDHLQRFLHSPDTDAFHVECRPVSFDGIERWVKVNGHGFFTDRGEPTCLLGTVFDITDRKRRETELLANEERCRRLNVELEQANRTKDQFLMTLSHELRTPLTAIAGWVRLLQSAKLSTEQGARALDVISRNVKTQTRIVDDLLDVSRIATGELRVHPIWCDASAVIEAAIDAIRPAAAAKDIRIDTVVEPDARTVFADPQRLQQVLWHVLANAVKFTGRWGQIVLACRRTDRDVEIAVTDNGEGIAPQFIPFVFDRFSHGDASPAREDGGQALGLAIVRHLVTLHGGSANAHSDGKGLGTTVTVRLPLSAAARDATDRPEDTPIRWPA
jgi:PAS domain S-box-containing protein